MQITLSSSRVKCQVRLRHWPLGHLRSQRSAPLTAAVESEMIHYLLHVIDASTRACSFSFTTNDTLLMHNDIGIPAALSIDVSLPQ
ncbi:hypothetical protein M378DRAFT_591954 [Amanita muscaria Koide BX008]|uniref:Uncharacterized protein n=1 Tax=Amanita muscaria (strain Koide BX008) TaxID=946122 RepID=A0A0C2W315_AMAMK|nr:hypothetical protein M378DRAFT_591954 [Amanita muscaria Koide BX008]